MASFADYRDHCGADRDRYFKATLFRGERLLVGVNCFEPGQIQAQHAHAGQDKVYVVLEGEGEFSVGGETRRCSTGTAIWAPSGVPHGVRNTGTVRLVVLVGFAPPP
jgi:quercetin dioxygenase-like cupin family protein